MKDILDAQRQHWQKTFIQKAEMFGGEPSHPARAAAELFEKEGKTTLLELGGGQGRDTLFFAHAGFRVHVLDYSESAVDAIAEKARQQGLGGVITALRHDVRDHLPFDDESFDGCYSHMLFCMALTTAELEFLSAEVRRVLRPNGLHVYTVRHSGDSDYGTGIARGEDMYEGYRPTYFLVSSFRSICTIIIGAQGTTWSASIYREPIDALPVLRSTIARSGGARAKRLGCHKLLMQVESHHGERS